MNTLSLDAAWAESFEDESPPAAAPPPSQAKMQAPMERHQMPPHPQAAPVQAQVRQAPAGPPPAHQAQQYVPPPAHQYAAPDSRRRKVRFVNDEARPRFARVNDGVAVSSPSWLEANKTLVMCLTVMVVLILIVMLVVVCRRKSAPAIAPAPGPPIPAYVGGSPGWEDSVSQYAPPAPPSYYN